MGIQSLVRIGFDLTIIAMILAGIRRNTGYIFRYEKFGLARMLHGYLSWGEYCYKSALGYVKKSDYFRKQFKSVDGFLDDIEEIEERDGNNRRSDRGLLPRH